MLELSARLVQLVAKAAQAVVFDAFAIAGVGDLLINFGLILVYSSTKHLQYYFYFRHLI